MKITKKILLYIVRQFRIAIFGGNLHDEVRSHELRRNNREQAKGMRDPGDFERPW